MDATGPEWKARNTDRPAAGSALTVAERATDTAGVAEAAAAAPPCP